MSTPERDDVVEEHDQRDAATGGGRRALLVLLVVAVAAVLLLFFITRNDGGESSERGGNDGESSQTTEESRPAAVTLLELDGNGDETTEVFEAALNWELRWQAPDAESFSVELFNEEGQSRGVLVEDSEESEGSTFVSEAGSFYLEVTSDSDWSLSIVGAPPD